jgi:hypothetical protein
VYDGEWKDGLKNGRGKNTFSNGEVYDGEWKDDAQHGRGKSWTRGEVTALKKAQAQHASAMQVAGGKIKQDTLKYKIMYTTYLDSGTEASARNRLDEGVHVMVANSFALSSAEVPYSWKKNGARIVQPDDAGLSKADIVEYSMVLREAFRKVMIEQDQHCKELVKRLQGATTNLKYERGPPKKDERLFEKAEKAYRGDLRKVTDFERCSFICDNFGDVLIVFNELFLILDVVRIKNRFARSNKTAKESGGYRDLQLVAMLQSGLLLEVQIHLEAFYKLKTEVAGDVDGGQSGHERYIDFRQLKEEATFNLADAVAKFGPLD